MVDASQEKMEKLSLREREILEAIGDGLKTQGIADRLYISPGTVRAHIANIFSKLNVSSRLQAYIMYSKHKDV